MTTKQAIKLLGMPYTKASLMQIYRWIQKGALKTVKASSEMDIDEDSAIALKVHLKGKPSTWYTSREVAELLGTGLHMPERYVLKGLLTAWRTPGSPRGKWKFPKMQALIEIEKILSSKK